MPLPVIRHCPTCDRPIDVRAAWSLTPTTGAGFPLCTLTSGTPAITCLGCNAQVALRTWRLSLALVVLWLVVILLGFVLVDSLVHPASKVFMSVTLVVAALTLRWLFTPLLITLGRIKSEERLNLLNRRDL